MIKAVTAVFADHDASAIQDTETGLVYGFGSGRVRDIAMELIADGTASLKGYMPYDAHDGMLEVRDDHE